MLTDTIYQKPFDIRALAKMRPDPRICIQTCKVYEQLESTKYSIDKLELGTKGVDFIFHFKNVFNRQKVSKCRIVPKNRSSNTELSAEHFSSALSLTLFLESSSLLA